MTPLLRASPTLIAPSQSVRVWCFEPTRDLIVQVSTPVFSLDVSSFLTGDYERLIQERFVRKQLKIRVVHDWRAVRRYEPQARDAILSWSRASSAHTEHVAVALSDEASPFVRIAIQTGVSVMRAFRMSIELVTDLSFVEQKFGGLTPSA